MPTASAILTQLSPSRMAATVFQNGLQYVYTMSVSPNLESFSADEAQVTYIDVADLSSTQDFDGTISNGRLMVTLYNGATITANIAPALTGKMISGSGEWEIM